MARRLVVEADGGSRGNPGPAGYGAVVRDASTGEVLAEVADGIGVASNNVAEYQGLIAGLRAALAVGDVESVEVRMDSKLVVEQMSGRWQVKHPDMRTLRREAAAVVAQLPAVTFTHIRRELNSHADRLANEAMDAAARGDSWGSSASAPAPAARAAAWRAPKGEPTSFLLMRHGQTALSVEKRYSGHGDPPLTAYGLSQAAALGARVASLPLTAVWTSPLARARSTAEAVASSRGLELVVDDRLRELDFGVWEGLTYAEIQETYADAYDAWLSNPSVPAPGGESFDDVALRTRRVRDAIIAAHPGEPVAVVAHVTPIKTLLKLALDAPRVLYQLHLDLASISQVDWYADGSAVVRRVNDTAHCEALTPE